MFFNPKIFFLAAPPSLVLWNCETHQQFELDEQYQTRLTQLIVQIEKFDFDHEIDRDLFNAGVLVTDNSHGTKWGWDVLSKIFHTGTKNIPLPSQPRNLAEWALQYSTHCNTTLAKTYPIENFSNPGPNLISLPAPNPSLLKSLLHGLTKRKTCRNYNTTPIPLHKISTVLYFGLGYLAERIDNESEDIPPEYSFRRSSPSGGGLNATEGYLLAANIESLPPGLYYYNPNLHSLELRSPLKDTVLGSLLNGQHFIDNLPLGIFLTSRFDKLWWKYEHSRAYRMALIEVGHVAQTLQLLMTSCGMQTWLTGALNENSIEQLLHLGQGTEEVLFFLGGGYGDGKAIPIQLKQQMAEQNNDPAKNPRKHP